MVDRVCSECGKSLAGKPVHAKTCCDNCRSYRSRRIRRTNSEQEHFEEEQGAGADEVRAIVRREATGIVSRVFKEQLEPIVREAIDEDVMRAIAAMVGLTPRAVELLGEDLESEDSTVRQRAYTLVTKYTVGHPALVKSDEESKGPLTVNFNLPRPDEEPAGPVVLEDEPARACDMCNSEKPESEFAAGSSRCQDCFDEWRAKVLERFA